VKAWVPKGRLAPRLPVVVIQTTSVPEDAFDTSIVSPDRFVPVIEVVYNELLGRGRARDQCLQFTHGASVWMSLLKTIKPWNNETVVPAIER
jgi:hypothetical protein